MIDKDFEFFSSSEREDFICDFEDNWLQYASANEKMKAYFGDISKAEKLFQRWKQGEDVWSVKKEISWNLQKESAMN